MTNKILSFVAAIFTICSMIPYTASAEGTEEIFENSETATTEVTVTTAVTTSDDELNEEIFADEPVSAEEFEEVKQKIENLLALFEENDYDINGITENVDGLNNEINGLQMSLDDIYSMLSAIQQANTNNMNSPSGNANSGNQAVRTAPTVKTVSTVTTAETTTTVAADTSPNAQLVAKAEKSSEERDFITVSTRDGHVFYLVIDYEGENQGVYFLNTVDTADLQRLLDPESTGTGTATATVVVNEDDYVPKTVDTETVEETEQPQQVEKPKKGFNSLWLIVPVIVLVVLIGIIKIKVSGKKSDDDDEDEYESADENESDNDTLVKEEYKNDDDEE